MIFSHDALIFDVDGVLIDTDDSYFTLVGQAIRWAWGFSPRRRTDEASFTGEHYRICKRHRAFNDDYDIAWAFLCAAAATGERLLSRALPTAEGWARKLAAFEEANVVSWVRRSFGETFPRQEVRNLCEELYFGGEELWEKRGRRARLSETAGLWQREVPLLRSSWKELGLPVGIYTGRPRAELELGLRLLGWSDLPRERAITPDEGISKPSPEGLSLLCRRMAASSPLFFGDTESDRQAWKSFGRGRFVAIGPIVEDDLHFATVAEALASLLGPPSEAQ
ncbi:HAD family hydrolase [Aminithiophilus ramosus]|uniref:HAD family hydrolase n=1 Tax=Aminithiophilus ramosus TaxID=3029084 RepID=A0A9Q7EX89_9BACT|nr:HAD family hydrolase [Aminithiophilus ramosus]QTX33459.1 HAD family hydrolase [Aminithiophilus ramosus]